MLNRRHLLIGTGSLLLVRPAWAATEHSVAMLNKDPDNKKLRMIFKPGILSVEAGDTIVFKPEDKGHNTQAIDGMLPDGAEAWKSKINKEFSVTLDKPGFYGYKCTPHLSVGMVGLIIVKGDGMMDNLEAAQKVKHRGKAKKNFKAIWETAEKEGLLSA